IFLTSLSFSSFTPPPPPTISPLPLHDALPISSGGPGPASDAHSRRRHRAGSHCRHTEVAGSRRGLGRMGREAGTSERWPTQGRRSEEHTSELQSLAYLVCRLLLEKKKKKNKTI